MALLTHKKDPSFWHGAILVAPMCKVGHLCFPVLAHLLQLICFSFHLVLRELLKVGYGVANLHCKNRQISEKVKPHPMVISLLTKVEDVIPRWKIVPTKDVIDSAFKDPAKREEVRQHLLASKY